jgi:hypothetical protein
MQDDRTDEDRIIEALVVEGKQALYEDIDFLPLRQSLYNVENVIPDYDDEVSQSIEYVVSSGDNWRSLLDVLFAFLVGGVALTRYFPIRYTSTLRIRSWRCK